jgi:sialic acid synthase
MAFFHINGRAVSIASEAYVIAEIGHNHEGDLDKAVLLFEKAAAAGASAAKLQKRDNGSLFTRAMYDEPYVGRNSFGPTYGAHREALEFGKEEYIHLGSVARDLGIDFLSTAFDHNSVDFLMNVDVAGIKIASADVTNTPLLEYAAATGKPLIISTGGAAMTDVRRAMDAVLPISTNVALLQCTAEYPATVENANLSVITSYRKAFPDLVVGLSSHDEGLESALVAYALGARVIEKHFTLDRARPGSDHHFSFEPETLAELVRATSRVRTLLGSPVKRRLGTEVKPILKMSKKLVAAQDLPEGHVLQRADLVAKSPGDGLQPYRLTELIGRRLKELLVRDDAVTFEHLA